MKIITSLIISLALTGSVFAGCPSKAIKGKFVSFDEESKTLTVKKGKKDQKVKIGSKTEMVGFECPSELSSSDPVEIHGCNCSNKTASKVALAAKKGKKKES